MLLPPQMHPQHAVFNITDFLCFHLTGPSASSTMESTASTASYIMS